MRGRSLLVTTIMVTLALSGCIQGLLPQDAPAAAPAPRAAGWVELPMPAALPTSGLLGLWVPEGTRNLRMASLDPNATIPYFDPDAWTASNTRPQPIEPMLVVRDPHGHVLAAGHTDTPFATMGPPTGAMRADPAIFLDLASPPPGLYAIALFGSHLPPRITLELPPDAPIHPVLPLGIGYHRHLLTTFEEGSPTGSRAGSMAAPSHAVRADVDLRGQGLQGHVRLDNATGAAIASHETTVANRLADEQNPLIFEGATLGTHASHPDATTAGKWGWDAALTGTGHAFAWTGQSVDLDAPHPLPPGRQPADALVADNAALRVPLAGTIRPGEAAWFTMPDDARIRPLFDDHASYYENGNGFRVYDQTGRRIMWDIVPDDARAYPLPAGNLLIVNDGTEDLTLEILDTAPADAALHIASLDVVTLSLGTPIVSGYWEQSASVFLPGPVSGIIVTRYDDLFSELSVSVTGLDGRVAANVPRTGFDGPLFPYYWPGLQVAKQDVAFTPWLDGGRYRVSASALDAASLAGLDIEIVTYTLDGGRGPDGEPHPTPGT